MEYKSDQRQHRGHQDNREFRHQKHKHSRSRSRSKEHHRKGYSSQQQFGNYDQHSGQQQERRQSRFGKQDYADQPDRQQQQQSRFSQRQERFQERPDRIQERQARFGDRFQEKQERFQEKQERFQEKQERFQERPERFQERQDRFQERSDRFQDRNQNFQRQSKFQQDNFQRNQAGGNRQQGRQQFNKGRRNQQQQQQQQQQPPQKLYYYEQLQQVNEELMKNYEAQLARQKQMISGEAQNQNQQPEEQASMIENLNEIEKLKNEYDPQKSQEQQLQEQINYQWDQWQNEESELFNAMDNELEKLLADEIPEQAEQFKLTEKEQQIAELVEQLQPYQQQWDNLTSLLINEFELIDMYRKPEIAAKRYSIPIVNYGSGQSKLGQIFARDYFKLWELLFRFKLLEKYEGQQIQIGNLSEGPGGFLNCLIDYRNRQNRTNWKLDKYVAMTQKNIDKKNQQIFDWDYFKTKKYVSGLDQQGYSIKLTYGASQDGDMLNTQNLIFFGNYELKDKLTNQIKKCHVVTANGGTEFSLFHEQSQLEELSNAKLFFAEVATALSVQERGGFFIMKVFNTKYEITQNILTLLVKYYKQVFIVKPFISHPVSNERYVVCDNFIGIDSNVVDKLLGILQEWNESENQFDYLSSEMFFNKFLEFEENTHSKFIENLKKLNEEIINAQIDKLKYSVELLTNPVTPNIIKTIKQNQFEQAKKWCIKFEIPYLFKLESL